MSSPQSPSRPRTPGRSPPPPDALPTVTENGNSKNNNNNNKDAAARRTSLGFLRRAKSTEPLGERKVSGSRSKKAQKELAREEARRQAAIPKHAPKLPDFSPAPQLKTFGGENARPDSVAIVSNQLGYDMRHQGVAMPPVPGSSSSLKEPIDPYARTESMTHRGRYSYASSAVSTMNSPRRVRRRKDPTPYNILVLGARNSGKTSFLNFLRTSLALPPNKRPIRSPDEFDDPPQSAYTSSNFTSHYLETEIDNERVGVTLWDSQGLESNVVDLQLREITSFLESKFEDTFAEEMKVIRAPGVRDTHIHCVFLILDPARLDANIAAAEKAANGASTSKSVRIVGGLDEDLDIQVMRTMQGKTTVVPIISKADTITTAHMSFLKQTVWDSLKRAKIDPLEMLTLEGEDDESELNSDKFDEEEEDQLNEEEAEKEVEKGEKGSSAEDESTRVQEGSEEPATPESESTKQPKSPPRRHTPRKSSASIRSINGNNESDIPLLPLSILSPDSYSLKSKDGPVGRQFPWGFADPYNPEHCDFVKLKESVFGEWRSELREASREVWYEGWRTTRLNRRNHGANGMKNGGRAGGSGRVTR